jgi:uncharacterized protein (TIGR02284 family)
MDKSKLIDDLNLLLTRNNDAVVGYKNATEDVQDDDLRMFFHKQAGHRRDFGDRIKMEIEKMGGEAVKGTSLTADFHRVWMDLKAFLGSNNEKAVLSEAMRGEKKALDNYNEVLEDEVISEHPELKTFIEEQRNAVLEAIAKLRQFENMYEYIS